MARTKTVAKDAVQEEVKPVEETVSEESKLAGMTVMELRRVYDRALVEESDAKRYLHVLRLRAANMATTASTDVDDEIKEAKREVVRAAEWIQQVERALAGEFKDISGIKFGDRV